MTPSNDQQCSSTRLSDVSTTMKHLTNSLSIPSQYHRTLFWLFVMAIAGILFSLYPVSVIVVLSALIFIRFALWYGIARKGNWKRDSSSITVQGTIYSFPFGDLPVLQANEDGYYLRDLHKRLGSPKVYRIWMGPEPVLMLAHADAVREFWKQHNEKVIEREVKFGWPLTMLMREGLGFKSYEDRNRINKYFHNSFSAAKINLFNDDITRTVRRYLHQISNICDKSSLDVYAELKYLAHDVSLYLFCGPAANQYLEEMHSITDEVEEIMSITFNGRWINIAGTQWILPAAFRLHNRIKAIRTRFKKVLLSIMAKYEQEDNAAEQNCVLARFVRDQSLQQCTISFDELMDTIIEGLPAPTEGSAATFTYSLIMLAKNPDVQTKLRDQLCQLSSVTLTELTQQDDYLGRILSECQRLQPIFMYNVPETASCDMIIDNVHIPKNSMIMLDVISLNQNSDVWSNPLMFEPDRFVDPSDLQRKSFHGFGNGRSRRCLGEHLIKAIHRLLIAQFVYLYEIYLPEPNFTIIPRKRRPFIFVPEQRLRLVPIHHS